MKKYLIVVTIIILAIISKNKGSTVSGCVLEKAKHEEAMDTATKNKGNNVHLIQSKTLQRETKSKDGTVILKCSFMYPQIKVENDSKNRKQIQEVNQLIEVYAIQQFQKKCTEAEDYTKEFINQIYQGNLPPSWLPLTVAVTYDITLNRNEILSFRYTDFEWLGGAHPSTNLTGFIYDTIQGKELKPEDLLLIDTTGIKQFIADEMRKLYQKNPENYFKEEVENLQKLNFDYGYYLNEEGLVFFFNQYEVAPYVTGVVSIPLKYSEHPEKFRPNNIFQSFNR